MKDIKNFKNDANYIADKVGELLNEVKPDIEMASLKLVGRDCNAEVEYTQMEKDPEEIPHPITDLKDCETTKVKDFIDELGIKIPDDPDAAQAVWETARVTKENGKTYAIIPIERVIDLCNEYQEDEKVLDRLAGTFSKLGAKVA